MASGIFKGSTEIPKLLRKLFEYRHAPIKGPDLALKVYGIERQNFAADSGPMRELISLLRKGLESHNKDHPEQAWIFDLPKGNKSAGYQLTVTRAAQTPTKNFWSAHLAPGRETPIVVDPLLFFYDHDSIQVTRFMDTNIDTPSLKDARKELELKHPGFFKPTLTPGHLYLDIGSFHASERLRQWFSHTADKYLPVKVSYETFTKDIQSSCPVFLGCIRTNTFLRNFFEDSPSGKKLAYRLHYDKYAFMTVNEPTERDMRNLKPFGLEVSDGIGVFTTTKPENTLGHITRVRNPGGVGHMTIITSDATYAVDKMAEILCSDEQLEEILRQTGWPLDQPLPDTFEWVFYIQLWPSGNADEAKKPELKTWRMPKLSDVI